MSLGTKWNSVKPCNFWTPSITTLKKHLRRNIVYWIKNDVTASSKPNKAYLIHKNPEDIKSRIYFRKWILLTPKNTVNDQGTDSFIFCHEKQERDKKKFFGFKFSDNSRPRTRIFGNWPVVQIFCSIFSSAAVVCRHSTSSGPTESLLNSPEADQRGLRWIFLSEKIAKSIGYFQGDFDRADRRRSVEWRISYKFS